MQTPFLDLNYLAPIPIYCKDDATWSKIPDRDPIRLLMRMAWHLDGRLADMRAMNKLRDGDPDYASEVRALNQASIKCQMLTIEILTAQQVELGEIISHAAQADPGNIH